MTDCDCPGSDGKIRHDRATCTDPVVAKLGWYADPVAGGGTGPVAVGLDWPAARRAIDTAISRAREEIRQSVTEALWELGDIGRQKAEVILSQVQDSLDDIDQTIPPEVDDGP